MPKKNSTISEDEFKERMLLSTTSAAHRMLRNLIQEGDNVGGIYHKLMLMHDNTMKPERAKEELIRNQNLSQLDY